MNKGKWMWLLVATLFVIAVWLVWPQQHEDEANSPSVVLEAGRQMAEEPIVPMANWRWEQVTPGPRVQVVAPVFDESLLVTPAGIAGMSDGEKWRIAAQKSAMLIAAMPNTTLYDDITAHNLLPSIEDMPLHVLAQFYVNKNGQPVFTTNIAFTLATRGDAESTLEFWGIAEHEYVHFKQWKLASDADKKYFVEGASLPPCNVLLAGEMQAHWEAARWMLRNFGVCAKHPDTCLLVNDETEFRKDVIFQTVHAHPECADKF